MRIKYTKKFIFNGNKTKCEITLSELTYNYFNNLMNLTNELNSVMNYKQINDNLKLTKKFSATVTCCEEDKDIYSKQEGMRLSKEKAYNKMMKRINSILNEISTSLLVNGNLLDLETQKNNSNSIEYPELNLEIDNTQNY